MHSPKELQEHIEDYELMMNQSSSRVVIMMESTEHLEEELEQIMRTEGLHVRQELLDCDDFDIEGKKQKSSVFEHKRYYEVEL